MSVSIVITLDPGHGGYDPGAIGPSGLYEKNVTLPIVLKVDKILEQNGVDVVYTRTSDNVSWPAEVGQDLQARTDISNNAGAKYFISIHANSSVSSAINGIETFYFNGNTEGQELANAIQKELISLTEFVDRGLKTANFYVLRNSDATSVLVEVGFISNPREEALLSRDDFQSKLAEAVAKGIIKVAN